jgi:uncharacterized Zn finger protein (UPF0148 family)
MQFQPIDYPCPSCGAYSVFSPEAGSLECPFCQTQTPIEAANAKEAEDYDQAPSEEFGKETKDLSCPKCGVALTFEEHTLSSHCSHCKTAIATETIRAIKPHGILPFAIGQKRATELFRDWIGSRWLAPSALSDYLQEGKKLEGHYFPHWSYSSDTTTSYDGERGDYYYETVTDTVTENGVTKEVQREERRTDWTPVSGIVDVEFKDIIITATDKFNPSLISQLTPWDMLNLKGFDTAYICGYDAEEHTVDIHTALESAKSIMANTIEWKIEEDIGGDEQRIDHQDTLYNSILYQSTLFPVYTASFRWKDKLYEYAINGVTGEVVGKRPYSYIKIIALVAGIIAVGTALYFIFKK